MCPHFSILEKIAADKIAGAGFNFWIRTERRAETNPSFILRLFELCERSACCRSALVLW